MAISWEIQISSFIKIVLSIYESVVKSKFVPLLFVLFVILGIAVIVLNLESFC